MSIKTSKLPLYCWDSDVSLAWFKAEQDKPLADMGMVVEDINSAKANLLLSVITYMEFLEIPKTGAAADTFRKFIKRSNVVLANVDQRVAEIAANVRERGLTERQRNIKIPDAIILATAIHYGADVLHSFDLANLDRTAIVDGLHISRPMHLSGQKSIFHEEQKPAGPAQG